VIDISCLGCKRSRVQISAARPNSSKTYRPWTFPRPPFGVQLESKLDPGCVRDLRSARGLSFPRRGKYPPGGHAYVLRVKSLGLSPLIRTRQTRHFGDKPLIPQGRSMSGSPKNPTWNPTKPSQKPDNQPPAGRRRYMLLTIHTLLRITPRPLFGWTKR